MAVTGGLLHGLVLGTQLVTMYNGILCNICFTPTNSPKHQCHRWSEWSISQHICQLAGVKKQVGRVGSREGEDGVQDRLGEWVWKMVTCRKWQGAQQLLNL